MALPCTCSSPPGLAFSSPIAVARSPDRTVVFSHCGSVSVFDATYLASCSRHPRSGSRDRLSRPSSRRRDRTSACLTGTRRRARRTRRNRETRSSGLPCRRSWVSSPIIRSLASLAGVGLPPGEARLRPPPRAADRLPASGPCGPTLSLACRRSATRQETERALFRSPLDLRVFSVAGPSSRIRLHETEGDRLGLVKGGIA